MPAYNQEQIKSAFANKLGVDASSIKITSREVNGQVNLLKIETHFTLANQSDGNRYLAKPAIRDGNFNRSSEFNILASYLLNEKLSIGPKAYGIIAENSETNELFIVTQTNQQNLSGIKRKIDFEQPLEGQNIRSKKTQDKIIEIVSKLCFYIAVNRVEVTNFANDEYSNDLITSFILDHCLGRNELEEIEGYATSISENIEEYKEALQILLSNHDNSVDFDKIIDSAFQEAGNLINDQDHDAQHHKDHLEIRAGFIKFLTKEKLLKSPAIKDFLTKNRDQPSSSAHNPDLAKVKGDQKVMR